MTFRAIKDCRRAPAEQRYIWSMLNIWDRLDLPRRETVRELIGRVTATPEEGRALFDVLVRGVSPQAESARTGVPLTRLYKLRCEFYERLRL